MNWNRVNKYMQTIKLKYNVKNIDDKNIIHQYLK
jgi:hypothetical protein